MARRLAWRSIRVVEELDGARLTLDRCLLRAKDDVVSYRSRSGAVKGSKIDQSDSMPSGRSAWKTRTWSLRGRRTNDMGLAYTDEQHGGQRASETRGIGIRERRGYV